MTDCPQKRSSSRPIWLRHPRRSLNFCLVLSLILCFFTISSLRAAPGDMEREEAGRLFHQGRYDAAARVLETLLRDAPDDAASRFRLGVCLHLAGRNAEALRELSRARLQAADADWVPRLDRVLETIRDGGKAVPARPAPRKASPGPQPTATPAGEEDIKSLEQAVARAAITRQLAGDGLRPWSTLLIGLAGAFSGSKSLLIRLAIEGDRAAIEYARASPRDPLPEKLQALDFVRAVEGGEEVRKEAGGQLVIHRGLVLTLDRNTPGAPSLEAAVGVDPQAPVAGQLPKIAAAVRRWYAVCGVAPGDPERLVAAVQGAARDAGLALPDLVPLEPQKQPGMTLIAFECRGLGTLQAMVHFLRLLEVRQICGTAAGALKIEPFQSEKGVQPSLILRGILLNLSGEAAQARPAAISAQTPPAPEIFNAFRAD